MIALRPARRGDGPAVALVHVEAWRAAYASRVPKPMLDAVDLKRRTPLWRNLITRHQASHPTVVAEEEGRIVGFVTATPHESSVGGTDSELHMIFVLPGYQRRDLGRRLFRSMAERIVAEGSRSMVAWMLAQPQAEAFFSALGGSLLSRSALPAFGATLEQQLYFWPDLAKLPAEPGPASER
jgi:L-amino acid N-acyltransferase YncA